MPKEARKFPEPQAFSENPRPPIELKPVESHKLKAVGYDAATKTLAVQFPYGKAIYHYPNVEPETHAAFIGAESLGRFFGAHIQALPFEKFPADPETAPATETGAA